MWNFENSDIRFRVYNSNLKPSVDSMGMILAGETQDVKKKTRLIKAMLTDSALYFCFVCCSDLFYQVSSVCKRVIFLNILTANIS